jgi:hypothetical protein
MFFKGMTWPGCESLTLVATPALLCVVVCSQSALDALAKEGMQLQFTEQFEAEGGEQRGGGGGGFDGGRG